MRHKFTARVMHLSCAITFSFLFSCLGNDCLIFNLLHIWPNNNFVLYSAISNLHTNKLIIIGCTKFQNEIENGNALDMFTHMYALQSIWLHHLSGRLLFSFAQQLCVVVVVVVVIVHYAIMKSINSRINSNIRQQHNRTVTIAYTP